MHARDYLHCPPNTKHITIGAGEEPRAILMVGSRSPGHSIFYPVDPVAAAYRASVSAATDSARDAFADRPPSTPTRAPQPFV